MVRRVMTSRVERRFFSRIPLLILATAIVADCLKHLWLDGRLSMINPPPADFWVAGIVSSVSATALVLVVVVQRAFRAARAEGIFASLHLAGIPWRTLLAPFAHTLMAVCVVSNFIEIGLITVLDNEPLAIRAWMYAILTGSGLGQVWFATWMTVWLNAMRWPAGAQWLANWATGWAAGTGFGLLSVVLYDRLYAALRGSPGFAGHWVIDQLTFGSVNPAQSAYWLTNYLGIAGLGLAAAAAAPVMRALACRAAELRLLDTGPN